MMSKSKEDEKRKEKERRATAEVMSVSLNGSDVRGRNRVLLVFDMFSSSSFFSRRGIVR